MAARVGFERRILILKCYSKCQKAVEVQRQVRRDFETDPPTRLTFSQISNTFDGTLQNAHKRRCGKLQISTNLFSPPKFIL